MTSNRPTEVDVMVSATIPNGSTVSPVDASTVPPKAAAPENVLVESNPTSPNVGESDTIASGKGQFALSGSAGPTLPEGRLNSETRSKTNLTISIVVPIRNEARSIEKTLRQLMTQQYDRSKFEVIVVDGESTDGTSDLVRKFATRCGNIVLLSNRKRLSSAARNIGIRHARGEIILIVDGHCEMPDDRMLENLVRAFEVSGADCVGRPQPLGMTHATTLQKAIARARSSRLGHHPDSFVYSSRPQFVPAGSVAVAYRREVFARVGYFDESFDACEDYEFNHRCDKAGLCCYLEPEVAVRYEPRGSLHGLFRQLVRYGRGRIRLLRKHPDTLGIKTLLPAVFVSGCVTLPLAAWLWPSLLPACLGVLATYGVIVLLVSIWISQHFREPRLLPWLPLVFLTVHVAAGIGLLIEACRPWRGFQLSS